MMVLCRIVCTYGLVTLLAASFVECVKFHEHLTTDQIATVFNTSPDNIPEYDVVTVRHNLYKRSSSEYLRLKFNAFGKEIDAYLQPSDGVLAGKNTPIWLASTQSNGTVQYKKMPGDIVGTVVKTFIEISQLSTILVSMPDGEKVSFTGFVRGMKIRPWPKTIPVSVRSKRERESSKASRSLLDTHHHVIFKSALSTNGELERKIHQSKVFNDTESSKSKRSTKDIIYPSILVATDFAPSNPTGEGFARYDDIVYQLAFWNAVDLRFRHVDNPKIRLRIAGIIIGIDRKATPYVNKYRKGDEIILPENFFDAVDYWSAMRDHPDFPLEAYDIVATITDNDMRYTRDGIESPIAGYAFTESLCLQSNNKLDASAIIRDKGGFSGLLSATHELGHVLGLKHDGNTGDECDMSHHYIMQPTTSPGPKNLEWSPCSLRTLSYFLRLHDINCVDEPAEFHPPGPAVQRLLPGDIVSTHKQCQGRGYDWACSTSAETCTNMECYYTGWRGLKEGWWCKDSGPAAEGTTCTPGHKCLNGVCRCATEECVTEYK